VKDAFSQSRTSKSGGRHVQERYCSPSICLEYTTDIIVVAAYVPLNGVVAIVEAHIFVAS
jgi:hypothetical protein